MSSVCACESEIRVNGRVLGRERSRQERVESVEKPSKAVVKTCRKNEREKKNSG